MRYTRLRNDFYDPAELATLMAATTWYGLPNQETLDGPVELEHVPTSIQQIFNYEQPYMSCGFVKVNTNYNLPPHEDNFLVASMESYRDTLGDAYIDWLGKTGNRNCSIMIPVKGDFKNTVTDLYWKDNKEKMASFTLNDGPVLFQTRGDVLHGVNNLNNQERITFQLSFGEDYGYIADKISALGLT
jgi:hypothetical protein